MIAFKFVFEGFSYLNEMKRKINSKMIAGTGILLAVVIVLQLISYAVVNTININLSLLAIAFGAIMYGPIIGGFLGLVSGAFVLSFPSTLTVFMGMNVGITIATCLTKTTIAGIVAGLIGMAFKNKHQIIGSIIASISVPLLNTGIFMLFSYFFFHDYVYNIVILTPTMINFSIEIILTVIIIPLLYKVIDSMNKNKAV